MRKKLLAGLAMGVFIFGITEMANAYTYYEAVDGDILWEDFVLDVGTNIVEGSTTMSVTDPTDVDPASFIVGEGMSLTSITYEVLSIDYINGDHDDTYIATQSFNLYSEGSLINKYSVDLLSVNPVALFADVTPLSTGTYAYQQGCSRDDGDSWTNDYRITFEVAEASPVPIPSAIWMLGSGLISLIGFRGKFRKA